MVIACLLAVLIIAAYLVYSLYFQQKLSDTTQSDLTIGQASSLKIISEFGVDKLDDKSFYFLKKSERLEYNRQTMGVSTGKDAPVPPVNISVYDPKIGRTLIIYWLQPEYLDYQFVRIYRGESANGEKKLVADELPVSGQFRDSDLQNDVIYYYEVRSVATVGESQTESGDNIVYPGFATDKTPPVSPENVTVTNTAQGNELAISWINPPDDDLAEIIIYRTEKFGEVNNNTEIARITDGSEIYLDQTVSDNIIYYYTITALDETDNESPRSLLITEQGNSHPFSLPSNNNSNINGAR